MEETPCDIRPVYQRDRDRILHCKAFRRLKHKTQVFLTPQGDHYRTRLTHTLEVAQTARTIARALRLNEDLTEAIALGHDLGHTPFGHAGERHSMRCSVKDSDTMNKVYGSWRSWKKEGRGAEPDLGSKKRNPQPSDDRSAGHSGRLGGSLF